MIVLIITKLEYVKTIVVVGIKNCVGNKKESETSILMIKLESSN